MKVLTSILLFFFSLNVFSNTLVFKNHGEILKSFSNEEIFHGKLNKLDSTEVKLYNAWRGYERTYIGYDFFKVLDSLYGNVWRNYTTIKFLAVDGYVSLLNIKSMLKAANGKIGYIAYKEKGKTGFTMVVKGDKQIDPGPFYLVWSNFNEGDKATYGDNLKWPYQLKEIDIL